MNPLAAIRRRRKVWIRRLGGPVAAVWLTMTWQPCVMAMEVEAGHEHHCEHCPPPEIHRCDDVVRHECSDEDRFSADRRAVKAKSADDTEIAPASFAISGLAQRLPVIKAQTCLDNPATAPPRRPLPILFCSWLN